MFSYLYAFFYIVHFLLRHAFLSHICDSPISLFMFFYLYAFFYVMHFCRIFATALII